MLVDLHKPLDMKDALPVPDFRQRPITREDMRRALIRMGFDIRATATRDSMERVMAENGITMAHITAPQPRPVVYQAPAPAAKRETIDVNGLSANQLRALCKDIDPAFKPPMKSNKNVYLAFLVAAGRIDAAEAFKDAD